MKAATRHADAAGWSNAAGPAIRYALSGRGARSLVLVHELGGSLSSWDAVAPLLEDEFRVLRYDQRGAGTSEKVREPYPFSAHVQDLAALVDAVGLAPPYTIAAVAAGTSIAIGFADRRARDVDALILCCPAVQVSSARQEYLDKRTRAAAEQGMQAVTDSTLALSYPEALIRDPAAYREYRGRFLANDPHCYALANQAFKGVDVNAAIDRLRCRTLVLAGVHDKLRPLAEARALSQRIAGSAFAEVDSGHLMPVQAPDELARHILRFTQGA
jgi:3-oxoadipate enol-lactonase